MTDPGSSEDTKQDKCKNKQTNIKTPKLIIFKLHKINFFLVLKKQESGQWETSCI